MDNYWLTDGSLDFAVEPENKAVVLSDESDLANIHNYYRSGVSSLKVLEEALRSSYCGMRFKRFSPFFKDLNEQIMRMFETGIIQYNERRSKKSNDFKNVNEDIGPQVLTMDHLGIGFIFWLVPLAVGVILFLIEVLIPHVKIFWQKLFLFCVVRAHLRRRIEMF